MGEQLSGRDYQHPDAEGIAAFAMRILILSAAIAAIPFAAHADEWSKLQRDIVAGTAPECAKPIAQLSPIKISHFIGIATQCTGSDGAFQDGYE